MADIKKICACGNEFTFTERDQEFYEERGYPEPKRCKPCRDIKKKHYNENTRPT